MQLGPKQRQLVALLSVGVVAVSLTVLATLLFTAPKAQERLDKPLATATQRASITSGTPVTRAVYLPTVWPQLVIGTPVLKNGHLDYEPFMGPPCSEIGVADVSWFGVVTGRRMHICAGWSRSDSEQGVLGVQTWPASVTSNISPENSIEAQERIYLTPERHGSITLLYLVGDTLILQASEAGHRFYFDLASLQWVSSPPSTTGVTPTLLLPDWTLRLTREQLDQAINKWRSQGIDKYHIGISIFDLSIGSHLFGDYSFMVSGDKAKLFDRTPLYFPKYHSEGYDGSLETRTAGVNWEEFLQDYTVNALFDAIGEMVDSPDPDYCNIQFDPAYGFPTRILCKSSIDAIYESKDIRVFSFDAITQSRTPVSESTPNLSP